MGIGIFLATLNLVYKDVSRVVTIILQYGIFVSGVLFPLRDVRYLDTLNLFNPLYVFIESSRSVVIRGFISNPGSYAIMAFMALAVFFISCRIFFVMEYRLRGIR